MTTIAVIGDPVLDQIYHASDPVLPGGKMLGRFFGSVPGGTTANFACAAARFGLEVQMIGRVADTWEGELHADALTAFGVNTDGLTAHDVARGAHTVIIIGPDGEKTLVYVPFPLDAAINPAVLQGHDMVYVMAADFDRIAPHLPGATAEICVDADAAAGLSAEGFARVAASAHVVFVNDVGFRKLTGEDPDRDNVAALLDQGPSLVCCTGGAGITYVATRDGEGQVLCLHRPARPARVVDTTGAGDCFNAAFLARRAQGADLAEALDFAIAAGALATEVTGAREAIPTPQSVADRMGR
ncbi:carbohydrate kinase family protein [Yoonia litorea]|uniref:Ribokinase n=1 Tax=Yoonia litorea TaxID=1123755 RepID=A0A1I6ME81_9RHOB|nr:carbohydrate kinase family protein [Yoonia litorea]SFS13933.1 ribokinase [Yoonia litorea]